MPIDQENLIENEEQADALLEQIDAPSGTPIEDAPAAAAAPNPAEEFALTIGGKEIKAPREKILKWAQMGYDAPTRIGSLTKEIESYKQKSSTWDEMEKKYGEIDKYVREKPDFWDHVTQSYQKRNEALQDQSNPLATTVNELKAQMQDLVQYKNQIEQQQQKVRMAREDQAYQQEFEGLKAQYPQIDFATPDESGKSLEYKVLEHANANGIRQFKTAFRDFYHDELVKHAEEQAKEKVAKEKQRNSKLGILGVTPTSSRRSSDDVRGKSYGDLASEIIEEYKLS